MQSKRLFSFLLCLFLISASISHAQSGSFSADAFRGIAGFDFDKIASSNALQLSFYQALFRQLPECDQMTVVSKNKSIPREAEACKAAMRCVYSHDFYYDAESNGGEETEIRGPALVGNKEWYVWAVKGSFQSKGKGECKFFYLGYFDGNKINDLFCFVKEEHHITNVIKLNRDATQKLSKPLMEEALKDREWKIDDKPVSGRIVGYRNKSVEIVLTSDSPKPQKRNASIKKMSKEDQSLVMFILGATSTQINGSWKLSNK